MFGDLKSRPALGNFHMENTGNIHNIGNQGLSGLMDEVFPFYTEKEFATNTLKHDAKSFSSR